MLGRPRRDAEILSLVLGVERVEAGADLDVGIRAGIERAPQLLAGLQIERRDVSADAQLGARVADEHAILDDDRRAGERLAFVDVADARPPRLLAGLGVDGDDRRVEQAVDDLAVAERGAAVHDVAAGDADRAWIRVRLVDPLHRAARFGEIDGDEIVGKRRDDVHRVAEDERLSLVAMRHAGRERRHDVQVHDVRRLDGVERAVAKIAVVAGRHAPLAGRDVGDEMNRSARRRARWCARDRGRRQADRTAACTAAEPHKSASATTARTRRVLIGYS